LIQSIAHRELRGRELNDTKQQLVPPIDFVNLLGSANYLSLQKKNAEMSLLFPRTSQKKKFTPKRAAGQTYLFRWITLFEARRIFHFRPEKYIEKII
jgi:hypothetical protein